MKKKIYDYQEQDINHKKKKKMKTVEIKIKAPKGFRISNFDIQTGTAKLTEIPKSATERIKTIEDVLKDNGTTQEEVDKMFKGAPNHLKYQYIAELLCKSLNEGWEADWDNSSEAKYFPWFKMSSSGFRFGDCGRWFAVSLVCSRLCLKNRELAEYAGKQFTDLYKKFMITK